jgi:hypothetical protein
MVCPNATSREFKRGTKFRLECIEGVAASGGLDTPRCLIDQLMAVMSGSQLGNGRIASATNLRQDQRNIAGDIVVALAALANQASEGLFEPCIAR